MMLRFAAEDAAADARRYLPPPEPDRPAASKTYEYSAAEVAEMESLRAELEALGVCCE